MLTGQNGILNRTTEAKIQTVVGSVKEEVQMLGMEELMKNETTITENLLADGKVKRTVKQGTDGKYYMYYIIKDGEFHSMNGLGAGNISSLKDVFLIDDNLNVRYIAKDGKEYGDNIENKILEDETKIRFSNKAFSEYVSKISGVTENEAKFKWMKNLTSLTIADNSVDSLQDLVFFPNLTSLTLGEYGTNIPPITSMDGIENCTKLQSLVIIYGPDKNYQAIKDLKKLTNFSRRYADKKEFDNIINGLKFCENLKTLELVGMYIDNMKRINELSECLENLNLNTNNISKIEGLEEKTKIVTLSIANNEITKITGIENLTNLKNVNLANNNISDITPLKANSLLMNLNLKGNTGIDGNRNNYTGEKLEALNKISEILDRGGTINLDTDKLSLFRNYTKLDFTNCGLVTLESLEGLTELTSLNLFGNNLTFEDEKSRQILSSMTKLKELNLYNNKVTNVTAINNLKSLKELILGGNNKVNLTEMEDIISNLNSLDVSTESLKTLSNCNINKITKLRLNAIRLTEIPNLSKFNKLTELSISGGNKIENINSISSLSNLESLNLNKCDLHNKMIDFSNLTKLNNLTLTNNALWSEDLEKVRTLKSNVNLTLDLRVNSIIDASALLELNLSTKIDLRNNVNLSTESKQNLTKRFGKNVMYDK